MKKQGVENAGKENAAQDCRGGKCSKGKCGTRLQEWKMQEKTRSPAVAEGPRERAVS